MNYFLYADVLTILDNSSVKLPNFVQNRFNNFKNTQVIKLIEKYPIYLADILINQCKMMHFVISTEFINI